MASPKISIIVPCYNQAQYLDECLQSVLDQSYQNWECIIVNDGSPDDTENVASNWTAKDERFKYLKKENGGLSSARNEGIESAIGDWILPLDCDDKIATNYLQLAAEKFSENPTIIYCDAEYFGDKKGKIKLQNYNYSTILIENLIFCTAFFKKEDWEKVKGYDENMKHGFEDWEFWLRILKNKTATVLKLTDVCFFYRIKENSMLATLEGDKKKQMQDYILNKHQEKYESTFGDYFQLLRKNNSLEKKNKYLNDVLNSKKHQLTQKIFKIFGK